MKCVKAFFSLWTRKKDHKRYCDYYFNCFGEILFKGFVLLIFSGALLSPFYLLIKTIFFLNISDYTQYLSLAILNDGISSAQKELTFLLICLGMGITTIIMRYNEVIDLLPANNYRKLSQSDKGLVIKFLTTTTIVYVTLVLLHLSGYLYLWLLGIIFFPILISIALYFVFITSILEAFMKYSYLKFKRKYCKIIKP